MDTYLAETAFEEFTVYAHRVGALLMGVGGVVDYRELTINGEADNLELGTDGVPVTGEVSLT